jgi:hypothetical protein
MVKLVSGVFFLASVAAAVLAVLALAGVCPLIGFCFLSTVGAFIAGAVIGGVGMASLGTFVVTVIKNWNMHI